MVPTLVKLCFRAMAWYTEEQFGVAVSMGINLPERLAEELAQSLPDDRWLPQQTSEQEWVMLDYLFYLKWPAKRGDIKAIQRAIDIGACYELEEAVQQAAFYGHWPAVRLLLERLSTLPDDDEIRQLMPFAEQEDEPLAAGLSDYFQVNCPIFPLDKSIVEAGVNWPLVIEMEEDPARRLALLKLVTTTLFHVPSELIEDAVAMNDQQALELIVQHANDRRHTLKMALNKAIQIDNQPMAALLIEKLGAVVDYSHILPVVESCERDYQLLDLVVRWTNPEHLTSALRAAVIEGKPGCFERLLDYGAQPNRDMWVDAAAHPELVQLLLNRRSYGRIGESPLAHLVGSSLPPVATERSYTWVDGGWVAHPGLMAPMALAAPPPVLALGRWPGSSNPPAPPNQGGHPAYPPWFSAPAQPEPLTIPKESTPAVRFYNNIFCDGETAALISACHFGCLASYDLLATVEITPCYEIAEKLLPAEWREMKSAAIAHEHALLMVGEGLLRWPGGQHAEILQRLFAVKEPSIQTRWTIGLLAAAGGHLQLAEQLVPSHELPDLSWPLTHQLLCRVLGDAAGKPQALSWMIGVIKRLYPIPPDIVSARKALNCITEILNSALQNCGHFQDDTCLRLLVESGADDLNAALARVARSNHLELAKWLVAQGARDIAAAFGVAVRSSNLPMMALLYDDRQDDVRTILHDAIDEDAVYGVHWLANRLPSLDESIEYAEDVGKREMATMLRQIREQRSP